MSLFQNTLEKWLAEAEIQVNGSQTYDIQVHDRRFYRRVLLRGSLGLGEAYMDGWWSCNDLEELVYRLIRSNVRRRAYRHPGSLALEWLNRIRNDQSRGRSKRAPRRHYDLDNDLFGAFLGHYRNYSCGYYAGASTLDEAQSLKLDLICRKLDLHPGDHLLEVGGGWGELALYAAANYGVRVTSINIAEEQMRYARAHCAGHDVDIVRCDYRDVQGQFDKIAAIAMFPHVGHRNHRTFMKTMHRALRPNGIFLIETTLNSASTTAGDPWIERYIFPGLLVPSGAQTLVAMEGLFTAEDIHNFGPHYVRTLRDWNTNLQSAWSRFANRYDDRVRRMFEYWFLVSAALFRARTMQYWHVVMTRQGDRQPACRVACVDCQAENSSRHAEAHQ
ncbi:MAG: cyclopropane fatty acyl phospholipid synthase [Bryobacteraceae bacterium]|jgi:cyclopropane-fatty-acyl-phospholipid synthase